MLDDAVEEKDGGEKVRLGMVVSSSNATISNSKTNSSTGHSWKLRCYARGFGENRRWQRTARRGLRNETKRISRHNETIEEQKLCQETGNGVHSVCNKIPYQAMEKRV